MTQRRRSDDDIRVKCAPDVAGLTFRAMRGRRDYPSVARVINRSLEADHYDLIQTVEDVARDIEETPHCNPKKDIVLAEVDNELIGCARVWWEVRRGGFRTYEHSGYIVPEWRGMGIREAMFDFCENRLTKLAGKQRSTAKKALEVMALFDENDWRMLAESKGYMPVRHNIEMIRPLSVPIPNLDLPRGFELRPVKEEDEHRIWIDCGDVFKEERNWAEERFGENSYWRFKGSRYWQPELWQAIWQRDELVAGTINLIDGEENRKFDRKYGWIGTLFVKRPWRNRGLARTLIARSLEAFKEIGMEHGALMVDTENPSGAVRLYEKMGFSKVSQYSIFQKPIR